MNGSRRDWIDTPPVQPTDTVFAAVNGNSLLALALARRQIQSLPQAQAFLDPDCYHACPPEELPGLVEAVDRLERAVRSKEPVCVWGDFDVDGQTSTTLLVSVLRELGAQVSYYIPLRAKESHGVNLPGLERVMDAGARLILTCDTGIGAHAAVERAAARGVDFVITDHHELPEQFPAACAAVNPRRLPAGHALGGLPGVGVAYEVALALCRRFDREQIAADTLDLTALGIVADLAPLYGDTRYLLQRGLRALRQTRRLGLQTLFEMTQLVPERISEEHIGFILGPRLNALGRLSDANPAVEFLTTRNPAQARILAAELEGLNARRRLLCEQVYGAARVQIEQEPSLLDGPAIVLSQPNWPAGVIGIVASRLVEEYGRPVVLIASPPGELARGSARSVAGCHITRAIGAAAQLLAGYGGHPMAAGLGLDPAQIPNFRRILNQAVAGQIGMEPRRPRLEIDAVVGLAELDLAFVENLERLAPFGQANPALVFSASNLALEGKRAVGKNGEHLQMQIVDTAGCTRKVIWWQGGSRELPQGRFDLAFTVRSSDYQGQSQVQIEWLDFRPAAGETIQVDLQPPARQIEDCRSNANPGGLVRALTDQPGVQVWAEGASVPAGVPRGQLQICEHLVIWTAPAGNSELQAGLELALPHRVTLIGQDPAGDTLDPFLQRLAGLAKFALRQHEGRVSLQNLAGLTAQRERTVRLGLDWLTVRGWLGHECEGTEWVRFLSGTGLDAPVQRAEIEAQLRALLAETAAYRAYFRQADLSGLL